MPLDFKNAAKVIGAVGIAATLLVMPSEGEKTAAYHDASPKHVPTICWGDTDDVHMGEVDTDTQCLGRLGSQLTKADAAVQRLIKVPMPDKRRAAFIDFVYNAGAGTFSASSVLRDTNAGNTAKACDDLAACVYNEKRHKFVGFGCGWSGNKRLPGLETRRQKEKSLCLEGT